jgi:FAD/FMN-containing dehydrogenase
VVLANSTVVTASKTQNEPLFWALRGAGMSFGIATSFKFRTIDQPDQVQLFYFPFIWNATQAKTGWRTFQDYVSSKFRPKEMNIRVVIGSAAYFGLDGSIFLFEGAYHGPQAGFQAAIEPFKEAAMAIGGFASFLKVPEVTNVSYMDALLYANNNALLDPTINPERLESDGNDQIVS